MANTELTINTYQNLFVDLSAQQANLQDQYAAEYTEVSDVTANQIDLAKRKVQLKKFEQTVGCKVLYICTLFIAKLVTRLIENHYNNRLNSTEDMIKAKTEKLETLASRLESTLNQMVAVDSTIMDLMKEAHKVHYTAVMEELKETSTMKKYEFSVKLENINQRRADLDNEFKALSSSKKKKAAVEFAKQKLALATEEFNLRNPAPDVVSSAKRV